MHARELDRVVALGEHAHALGAGPEGADDDAAVHRVGAEERVRVGEPPAEKSLDRSGVRAHVRHARHRPVSGRTARAGAAMPATGMPTQSGRLLSS